MSKENRDKGQRFEDDLARLLGIKTTARSGAHWDDADLRGSGFILEAKVKATKNYFSSSRKEIDKVKHQADRLGVDWVYAVRDGRDNDYILCSSDFFAELYDRAKNNE